MQKENSCWLTASFPFHHIIYESIKNINVFDMEFILKKYEIEKALQNGTNSNF